jgi:urea carboxylase-associated protein 2
MTASSTDTPAAAREHARAMAGTRVEAMPTIPATAAVDLPSGVTAETIIWDETIAAGGYASRRLNRGARLRLTDLRGDACVSMLAFNAEQVVERLNVADTLKVQWNAYLGAGRLVLSDMGRVMFSIVEDTAGGHDALCGPSNVVGYGGGQDFASHPTARERFLLALARYGLGRKDVHPCINWFKAVTIAEDGATQLQVGPFGPGRFVTLRAEMDVIVVLANCPHVLDQRDYVITPVRATAWRGLVTPEADPIRNATPEGLRAFENLEDYLHR